MSLMAIFLITLGAIWFGIWALCTLYDAAVFNR
ncbi:hypothetical protein SAMN05421665_1229 [Yoonia rosea]|uniref:Uncharacterized protein n=1 Tax=Yoonia rosea TaxID=287098 RepID=A0A1R3WWJ8_9RHOB|nr:hypothetical protein SAMN05421665_1229 [Yoonia rosea]